MINSQQETPEIKRDQVQRPPDLTDDTRQHRQEEARYGMSIPLVTGLVAVIFVIAAVLIIWVL